MQEIKVISGPDVEEKVNEHLSRGYSILYTKSHAALLYPYIIFVLIREVPVGKRPEH